MELITLAHNTPYKKIEVIQYTLLFIYMLTLIYIILRQGDNLRNNSIIEVVICLVIFMTFLFTRFSFLHEFLHYIASKQLGYSAKMHKRWCDIKGIMKKSHCLMIALFPFIIEQILYWNMFLFLFYYYGFLVAISSTVLILASVTGALGDLFMVFKTIKAPNNSTFEIIDRGILYEYPPNTR